LNDVEFYITILVSIKGGAVMAKPRRSKARFVVDFSHLDIPEEVQKEIAKAIQATVLQLLATRLTTRRPFLDLARAPGPSGWAGAFAAEDYTELQELQKIYQWGRPGGKPVDFFDTPKDPVRE
jgi:hypothetical protein